MPKRLYKYRPFNNQTLDMLISDKVYYADPITFNDPLDTRSSLEIDLDEYELKKILVRFVKERIKAKRNAVAKTIRLCDPKTMDHIEQHSRRDAENCIAEISYQATNPDYDSDDVHSFLLGQSIERELLMQYDKGVFSVAERATCPLMWSHYGDQHRGICIGYSVPEHTNVCKVRYGGSRLVEASKVAAMLAGDDAARDQVDEGVLLRKAYSWRYEREWRLIAKRGLQESPLELEQVIFGIRCENPVRFAVVKALESRDPKAKFYEMHDSRDNYRLKKKLLDVAELSAGFPRRSVHSEFVPGLAN